MVSATTWTATAESATIRSTATDPMPHNLIPALLVLLLGFGVQFLAVWINPNYRPERSWWWW